MSTLSKATYVVLVAVLEPPGEVRQYRIELRDFYYRLIRRAQLSPATAGGEAFAEDRAIAGFREMVAEGLRANTPSLGGEDRLD